jgi:multisubunit Na+/H+ antiporter MnhB subunit
MSLRRLHTIVGLAGLVTFAASGQYMDLWFDHLRGMKDAPRLLMRSAHIYLLLSSLLNLALGAYVIAAPTAPRRYLQWVGSAMLATGPAVFAAAFLFEPWLPHLQRPYTRWAVYAAAAGVLLHVGATAFRRPAADARAASGSAAP